MQILVINLLPYPFRYFNPIISGLVLLSIFGKSKYSLFIVGMATGWIIELFVGSAAGVYVASLVFSLIFIERINSLILVGRSFRAVIIISIIASVVRASFFQLLSFFTEEYSLAQFLFNKNTIAEMGWDVLFTTVITTLAYAIIVAVNKRIQKEYLKRKVSPRVD